MLVSEAYFRFTDTDWGYSGQEENAYGKGITLLQAGCAFCESGTRRRRTYATQEMVLRGLIKAAKEYNGETQRERGDFTGTSNVHFAHRFDFSFFNGRC